MLPRLSSNTPKKGKYAASTVPSSGSECYWITLGCVFIGLGATHAVLSLLWRYWFGVAVALSVAKTGMTALSTAYMTNKSTSLPWMIDKIVSWGSHGIRKLFTVFRWPMFLVAVYVGACIAIHVYSPDPAIHTFPSSCQESAPSPYLGCNRIEAVITIPRKKATVDSSSTRERRATGGEKKRKEEPPRKIKEQNEKNTRALLGEAKKRPEPTKTPKDIEAEIIHASPSSACASKDDIGQIAREWVVQSHAFSTILEDTADEDGSTFIHARILSTVFGFADDLFMSIQDAEDGSGISVRAQGQLRLGVSDIGVNARRNKKFILHLQQACM